MIGAVMPVLLNNDVLVASTCEAVATLCSSEPTCLIVVCTRLHACTPGELQARLMLAAPPNLTVLVDHDHGVERSVAGAWARGFRVLLGKETLTPMPWRSAVGPAAAPEFLGIVANDVRLADTTLDTLAAFGREQDALDRRAQEPPGRVAMWSGSAGSAAADGEGCDFSLAMLRPATVRAVGYPDHNFRPAYFEDGDFHARVALAGGTARVVAAARFHHLGSLTIRADADAAHHVRHWFEINRARFVAKWGREPAASEEEMRRTYFRHPWNDASKPLWYFEGAQEP